MAFNLYDVWRMNLYVIDDTYEACADVAYLESTTATVGLIAGSMARLVFLLLLIASSSVLLMLYHRFMKRTLFEEEVKCNMVLIARRDHLRRL